jgi:hypothetical protein
VAIFPQERGKEDKESEVLFDTNKQLKQLHQLKVEISYQPINQGFG